MSLVTYSDSESEDELGPISKEAPQTHGHSTSDGPKRKRSHDDGQPSPICKPPPLPSSLANLYASNVRSSINDNPSLHQGRRRQIPHIEGNWPSFVYLEWTPLPEDLLCLEDLIASVEHDHDHDPGNSTSQEQQHQHQHQHQQVRSSLRSDLGVLQPLHVSLSTPLILTTDNKDAFESTLTRNIQEMNLSAFTTSPSDLRWVSNFDGTRRFLIMMLKTPEHDELHSLLSTCNRTVASFGLTELYSSSHAPADTRVGVVSDTVASDHVRVAVDHIIAENGKFHISLAWSLEKISTDQAVLKHFQSKLQDLDITFDRVFINIGNQVSTLQLQKSVHHGGTG